MGIFDALFGRSTPKAANLDALFAVPAAALTLQTTLGLTPTGAGAVCYRSALGAGFADAQSDITALLSSGADAPEVSTTEDEYGFTWLTVQRDGEGTHDVGGLVTHLHAVNTTLEAEGYGPALLCSLIPFADVAGRRVALVYLYKRGTFYPFAPALSGGQQRDNVLEFQLRDALARELPLEPDLQRWLAVWGAPGL